MAGTGEAEAISVKFEGFSIREYVSKTRSTNVMKCWPFGDGTTSEQMMRNFLPPISVEKFRWWSHEFDLLKSDEQLRRPLICGESSKSVPFKPVKNSGGESSTVMMRSIRVKRKKRSILEIFAEEDADEGNDPQNLKLMALREVGLGLKQRKTMKERKNNKKKSKLKDESDKQNVGLKLKKIIGSERVDRHVESSMRKEKPLKVKMHSSVAITKKPINKSRFNKGLLKGTSHHIVSTKDMCQMKSLTEQHEKNKNPGISKSKGKNKKPIVPVRGILKKYKEDDILVKRSTLDNNNNPEDDCERNLISLAPKSGRHVRFSGKDDVVVSSPSKQLEETEASASPLGGTNKRSDEIPEVQFTCDREFVRPQIGFRGEHFHETSTLLNEVALPNTEGHRMFATSYGVASNDTTYGLDPRNLPRYGSNTSTIPSNNAKKNPMLPDQYFGTYSSSSSSYIPISDDGRAAVFPYGRYHHLTPKELMWSICSVPPERKQREFTNGLFGLPLNSQGELIQLNSTGEASFNQMMMPASTPLRASTSSYSYSSRPTSSSSSLDMWKNEETRRKLNHLSFLETELHPNQLAPSFIGLSTSSYRENDTNPATTSSSTPTIRLMGKELTVKGSSLEDEKVWTDKEIIAEHRPPPAAAAAAANYGPSDNTVKHNHLGFMMSSSKSTTPSESVPFQLHSNGTTNTSFSMNQYQQRPPFPLEFPFINQQDHDNNSEELLLQPSWFKKHNYHHHPYSFSRANINSDSRRHSMQPTIGGVSYPYPQQQQQQQQQRLPFQAYSQLAPFSGGTSHGGIINRFTSDHVRRNRSATVEEKKWRKRSASRSSIASSGKPCKKIPNNSMEIESVDQEGNKMMGSNGNEDICRPMLMYSTIISSPSSVAPINEVSGSEKSASAALLLHRQ
ncbi:uncharacterized protein LOC124937543 [Impatiens glandulifera]|uniref:uncharacterized protein LOC124937543 n=1 Tax=Impatiens glandulifera TaxID=253017 RepID=UPI001FB15159|nr:uncharacterized protein LOC124937543 [Impatiens glandulifera]